MRKDELSSKLPGAQEALTAKQANKAVEGYIDSNGEIGAVYFWREDTAKKNYVNLKITGTFVGTIAVQIADPGEDVNVNTYWVTVTNGSFTAPTSKNLMIVADANLRVLSTAWTSGTAKVSLS